MSNHHLSVQEQEAFLIDRQSADTLDHLAQCAQCRGAVDRLESTMHLFRASANSWAEQCLAVRPQSLRVQVARSARRSPPALRWALAVVIPVLLFVLAMLPFRSKSSAPPQVPASLSDDALLEQVDDQLSVAVPSSMESLTHLVSTGSQPGTVTAPQRSKPLAQTN